MGIGGECKERERKVCVKGRGRPAKRESCDIVRCVKRNGGREGFAVEGGGRGEDGGLNELIIMLPTCMQKKMKSINIHVKLQMKSRSSLELALGMNKER